MTTRPDLTPLRGFASDPSLAREAAVALMAAWRYRGGGGDWEGTPEQLEVYVELREAISALSPEAAMLLGTHLARAWSYVKLQRLRANLARWARGRT